MDLALGGKLLSLAKSKQLKIGGHLYKVNLVQPSKLESNAKCGDSSKETGLIQINTKRMEPLDEYIKSFDENNSEIKIVYPAKPRFCMTGWFQFGRRKDWLPIPKELKYFYGDDLLIAIMARKGCKVARLVSDYVSHMESSTVSKIVPVQKALEEEGFIFKQIVEGLFR